MTKGSDLLVAALENEGVEHIFGVPGEENTARPTKAALFAAKLSPQASANLR